MSDISTTVFSFVDLCVLHLNSTDTELELEVVRQKAMEAGAFSAVVCTHWADGGPGAVELANAVIAASKQPSNFQFLYELNVCAAVFLLFATRITLQSWFNNVRVNQANKMHLCLFLPLKYR